MNEFILWRIKGNPYLFLVFSSNDGNLSKGKIFFEKFIEIFRENSLKLNFEIKESSNHSEVCLEIITDGAGNRLVALATLSRLAREEGLIMEEDENGLIHLVYDPTVNKKRLFARRISNHKN